MGRSNYPNIPAEFSKEPFKRGTVGMARSQDQIPLILNSLFVLVMLLFKWSVYCCGRGDKGNGCC